jgi:hypothetical protein
MKKSPTLRHWWLAFAVLAAVICVLFYKSFIPGQALFSNDGPLGIQMARSVALPQGFFGMWYEDYWIGSFIGSYTPNFTSLIQWLSGPMGRVNWYAPLATLVCGMCAWVYFLRLGGPRIALLGGLAAMLNSNYFSNACWGLPSRGLALGAIFLALTAIELGIVVQPVLTTILAGLAIGISVTEGGDNGAIFSLFVSAYAVWRTVIASKSTGKAVAWGLAKVVIMGVFAAAVAYQTVHTFSRTAVQGIVGTSQEDRSKQERWDFATQWSLPKLETLRVIIPGVFGYRMDTPDGGNYWGRVGEAPSNPAALRRHSGAGEYAGVLVVLLAIWAVVESLRAKGQIFTVEERKLIWFWAVMGFIAMLCGWGRHAPFYKLVYALPYFSTIRNPMKFFHVLHLAIMILFAYGLLGLNRRYLEGPAKSTSLFEQLKAWWSKAPAHERLWTWGCIAALAVSAIGWFGYAGSRKQVVNYLMSAGFPDQDAATMIAKFSANEVFLFVVFLAFSVLIVTLILSGAFSGPRAKWAALLLGTVLVVDLARANAPWIVYYNWHEKYDVEVAGKTIEERRSKNPVVAVLREKPYEHRVMMPGFQLNQDYGLLQQVYQLEWLQHHFPYYGIQSLDIPQEPRVPEEKQAYRIALSQNIVRLWELTNTRYVFGLGGNFIDSLNQQIDPAQKRFRVHSTFGIAPRPGITRPTQAEDLMAVPSTNGAFALIEFTGALPRAKLYNNWEIIPDGTNVLARLADRNWNPAQSVVISDPAAPKPGDTNAAPGTAEIISNPSPKIMNVRTKSAAPAMLLLNDKIDPEWNAYIDGKQAPIYRANFLMRGVHVPAGEHEVTFKFEMQPTGFYVVLASEIFGLIVLGIVIWSVKRQRAAGVQSSKAA